MLDKLLCVSIASLSYALMLLPPKSSRSVWTSRTDRIKRETSVVGSPYFAYVMTALTVFQSILYLLLMVRFSSRNGPGEWNADFPEVQQLKVLRKWHVVATLYQLTIRPGHRLVTSGPYKYLLHPSYTGYYINTVAVWTLLWHQGLFDVFSAFFARAAVSFSIPLYYAVMLKTGYIFGISGGLWVVLLVSVISAIQLHERVMNEEAMLKGHFGAEWIQHANKRWRFIPDESLPLPTSELALVANSRVEKAVRMIQNLRNQIKSDTELVKSAKKAESKLESLSYTNSLLVRQLLQEQDRLKAVQAQAVKEAAVRVQEPEVQVEQERVHLKIQTDSQLDLKNESIEVVSKDARIASLEADVRALEGELECAKLWVEQHSEAASQAEERSRNSIKTVENQNLALMEEVRQCSDKLVAKEEEIDRLTLSILKMLGSRRKPYYPGVSR
ncbi:hypothetical protein BGX34_009325 [Mortierella sp. NVP85]|nr:hypothetical protein BGX34_009325 [Mortierella sp. NVP85]